MICRLRASSRAFRSINQSGCFCQAQRASFQNTRFSQCSWKMDAKATEGEACEKPKTSTTRVAVVQMNSTNDKQENLENSAIFIHEAKLKGCSMVFFPECFAYMGVSSDDALSASEPLHGDLMQKYCNLAREHGVWLSLGGFHESDEQNPQEAAKMYNTHVIVTSSGKIAAKYHKIHLFDVDIPNGPQLKESRLTKPGTNLVTCDSPVGLLGLSTCYDVRFASLYDRLVTEGGARILLVPSAFTKPTGEAHWHALLRARAIENQTYVIAAAQTGRHNARRESYGSAMVISPWGEILAEIPPGETGIATAEIDMDSLDTIRINMPLHEHRSVALGAVNAPIQHQASNLHD